MPTDRRGSGRVGPWNHQPSKGPAVGDILLWIVLISAALGTGCTALVSSGTGRLWHVDALELRRQQRFRHVLSCHVDAIRLSRREAAAPAHERVCRPSHEAPTAVPRPRPTPQ